MRYWWLLFLFLFSCKASFKGLKLERQNIYQDFHGTFTNKCSKAYHEFDSETLLSTFLIDDPNGDSVSIHFGQRDSLCLEWKSGGGVKKKNIRGEFIADGFYLVTFRNSIDRGFFESSHDVKKVYLSLDSAGALVVNDYLRDERRFLLWGVGGTIQMQRVYSALQ